jgi:Wiskott-Aldrich syndrome protein
MYDPLSAGFTAADKQRYPYLSSVLEPSMQKVIATAAVRVYYAPFNNPHINWSYSKLKGILVFGRDRDATNGTSPPKGGGHGLRLKQKYWFRLVDMKTDRVVWMFSIPDVFEYTRDKPFFHYFSGAVRLHYMFIVD